MAAEHDMVRMAFVGDLALGNHPKTPGFGFYSRYLNGIPDQLGSRVLPSDTAPDVVFGNLEFALTGDASNTNLTCVGSASYARFLRRAGFTVVNLANNHAWQHGAVNFWRTVDSLRSEGIKVVGIADDFDPSGFLRIRGRTVAFIGCSARPRQGFTETPGYNEFDRAQLLTEICDARRRADLVCVSIHWGEEFIPLPSPEEERLAKAMIEAGATAVIGHHPHVLRDVEIYRGGVIAYSLGNFIGDMTWNELTRETGCLIVEANDRGVASHKLFPARIERDYFPRYLDRVASLKAQKRQETRRSRLMLGLERYSYRSFADRALRRHQWLTVGFLLRNLFRYRLPVLRNILSHALRVRFQRQQGPS